jgi:hypothetical protein
LGAAAAAAATAAAARDPVAAFSAVTALDAGNMYTPQAGT